MHQIDFSDQVAIVTGAGGSIGREIALLLAKRGAKVLVNDYGGTPFGIAGNADRAEAVAREIREAGGEAVADSTAVGTVAAAGKIRDAAIAAFGRIDVLVNNAGVVSFSAVDELTDEELDRVVEINFLGAFRLLRAVWPVMKQQGYGRILNVSSNSSIGYGGVAAYASSKAALLGLTGDVAHDGKPFGILVNSMLPAAATRLTNAGRDAASNNPDAASLLASFDAWLQHNFLPHKVAPAAVYLVSSASTVTGEHFSVGAGRVSRIAHFSTNGYFEAPLTPESVASHIEQIRDTEHGSIVTSGTEELQTYMGIAPFPVGE